MEPRGKINLMLPDVFSSIVSALMSILILHFANEKYFEDFELFVGGHSQ